VPRRWIHPLTRHFCFVQDLQTLQFSSIDTVSNGGWAASYIEVGSSGGGAIIASLYAKPSMAKCAAVLWTNNALAILTGRLYPIRGLPPPTVLSDFTVIGVWCRQLAQSSSYDFLPFFLLLFQEQFALPKVFQLILHHDSNSVHPAPHLSSFRLAGDAPHETIRPHG
jgi:hypothetical protein